MAVEDGAEEAKLTRQARRAEAHRQALAWLREGVTTEDVVRRLRKSGFSQKGAERVATRADDALQRVVNPIESSDAPTVCAECGEALAEEAKFCDGCGARVPDEVDADFRRTEVEPHLIEGRKALGAMAILYGLGALLFGLITHSGLIFAINAALAAIQTALWQWSKRDLLPAAISSLVLFVTVHLLSAIGDPTTLFQGIIVKIIFVVVVVRAIQAGLKARSLVRERASDS